MTELCKLCNGDKYEIRYQLGSTTNLHICPCCNGTGEQQEQKYTQRECYVCKKEGRIILYSNRYSKNFITCFNCKGYGTVN